MAAEDQAEPGQTRERLAKFLKKARAAIVREDVQRYDLRLLQAGGAKFVYMLDEQTRLAEDLRAKLARLNGLGAGYGPQIREIEAAKAEIAAIRADADAIRQMSVAPLSTQADAKFVHDTWKDRILPLRNTELKRQARHARVQGALVETRSEVGIDCNGMLGEATVLAVQFVRDMVTDPVSRLGRLWHWLTLEGERPSLWLYHHDAESKWRCLFFRIELTRAGRNDLYFLMESYVPFGLDGDPAQYAVDETKTYKRPGWRQVDVFGDSYNRSNTYSLNSSETQTIGQSFGITTGTSETRSTGTTAGTSNNTSQTVSDGFSESFSWFNNRGASFNSSFHGGGGSSSSSGSGESGSWSINRGRAATWGSGTQESATNGIAVGTNKSEQATVNDSIAVTIGNGFAITEGSALQVEHYNVGIDYSQKGDVHLAKWREGNAEAARIYDEVIRLFDSMCREVIQQVQQTGVGTGAYDGRSVTARLADLRDMILIEPPGEERAGAEPLLRIAGPG